MLRSLRIRQQQDLERNEICKEKVRCSAIYSECFEQRTRKWCYKHIHIGGYSRHVGRGQA